MDHVVGNPTWLMHNSDAEQRTEENISDFTDKTRMVTKSTINLDGAGPSGMEHSISPDISPLSKEILITLKPKIQPPIVETNHLQKTNSPHMMCSASQRKVDGNIKVPEVPITQLAFSSRESTSQGRVDEHCLPIFSLTPYSVRWTIKAWVSNKSLVHNWKSRHGKTFTVDLIDESGEIRGTAFNECCDLFYDIIEANNSYYISNCEVILTNRKYTSIKYEYQLNFTKQTKIIPTNTISNMPPPCFNFQPIDNIWNLPLDECIDVLGVCKAVSGDKYVLISLDVIKKQDLTLVDSTNTEVMLTLWGSDASDYLHQVIAIKGAKISEFMGRRSINMTHSGYLKINPEISMADELRHWYNDIGWIQLTTSISTSLPLKEGEEASSCKTLLDLEVCDFRALENFCCPAFIVQVKKQDVLYRGCPTKGCKKKLIAYNDTYWCEFCEREFTSFTWRMVLKVKIGDFTHQVWVTCFHEEAEGLLNVTADELARAREQESQEKSDQIFENITFRYFKFILKKRVDNYKREEGFKIVAVRVEKLSYIEHNRKLIRELRFKHMCH